MNIPTPWRDPVTDPPEEYTEVIVQTETGRVRTAIMMKGRWNTHVPIVLWQPMPAPVQFTRAKPRIVKKKKGGDAS